MKPWTSVSDDINTLSDCTNVPSNNATDMTWANQADNRQRCRAADAILVDGTPGDELKSGNAQNPFLPQVYAPLGLLIASAKSVALQGTIADCPKGRGISWLMPTKTGRWLMRSQARWTVARWPAWIMS